MDPEPSTLLGISLFGVAQFTRILIYIVTLLMLVLLSAFFSAAETAYTSLNRIRLKSLESGGNKRAGKVLRLLDNYDRILSTILIGNNIVNISAASITTLLFANEIMPSNTGLATVLSTVTITALILIFGEITPKSMAKEGAERMAMAFLPFLSALTVLFAPLNAIFWVWKKFLRKIFKLKKESGVTEDELITMIEEAENEGELEKHESELIRSAIEFDDVDVGDVMSPRVKVVAVEDDDSMEEIAEVFRESGFSRLPVYNDSIDQIIGIIHEKDFSQLYRESATEIKSIIQPNICVSENMKISDALRMLQKAKTHMAIVVDEFGGTAGIITMEDILEELVGEIWDEHDEIEVHFKKLDDKTYLIDGEENFQDMIEFLAIDAKEEFESTTVGGFVTEVLKKIPSEGESFDFGGYNFEVIKANAKTIEEIKATYMGTAADEND